MKYNFDSYVLVDNPLPIVVMRTRKKVPPTGCKMVNHHMLYVVLKKGHMDTVRFY